MKKLLVVLAVAFTFVGCSSNDQEICQKAMAVEVQNETEIIIELLHEGYVPSGFMKVSIDTSEYIVVKTKINGGVAIIKHN